jgi:hypothetical protein
MNVMNSDASMNKVCRISAWKRGSFGAVKAMLNSVANATRSLIPESWTHQVTGDSQ